MSNMPKVANGLNHVAYVTEDTARTRRFYEEVLGFPLVAAVRNDYDPETRSTRRSLHTFFAMGNGEVIAFFEIEGVKQAPRDDAPQAQPPRQVEEHHRVARREPPLHRAAEVAVHDPALAGDEFVDFRQPFLVGRLDPTRAPVVLVEVD